MENLEKEQKEKEMQERIELNKREQASLLERASLLLDFAKIEKDHHHDIDGDGDYSIVAVYAPLEKINELGFVWDCQPKHYDWFQPECLDSQKTIEGVEMVLIASGGGLYSVVSTNGYAPDTWNSENYIFDKKDIEADDLDEDGEPTRNLIECYYPVELYSTSDLFNLADTIDYDLNEALIELRDYEQQNEKISEWAFDILRENGFLYEFETYESYEDHYYNN